MDAGTRKLVWQRAENRCEYCQMPQDATPLIPFHVEHIVAQQHQGGDGEDNLAIACDRCNAFKGPNLTTISNETGELVRLFHPRRDLWHDHFRFDGGTVVGLTTIGRATARLLNMNSPRRVQLREEWIAEGNEI